MCIHHSTYTNSNLCKWTLSCICSLFTKNYFGPAADMLRKKQLNTEINLSIQKRSEEFQPCFRVTQNCTNTTQHSLQILNALTVPSPLLVPVKQRPLIHKRSRGKPGDRPHFRSLFQSLWESIQTSWGKHMALDSKIFKMLDALESKQSSSALACKALVWLKCSRHASWSFFKTKLLAPSGGQKEKRCRQHGLAIQTDTHIHCILLTGF